MTDETNNGAVVVVPGVLPPVKALVLGSLDVEGYQRTCLSEARQRVALRESALGAARADLTIAEDGYAAACYAGVEEQQDIYLSRMRGRRMVIKRRTASVENGRKFLSLVEEGYLPMPRIPAVGLHWLRDPLPPEVLYAIATEQEHGRFTKFVVANGEEASRFFVPTGRKFRDRDPILIGLCDGEMFPLAWWR